MDRIEADLVAGRDCVVCVKHLSESEWERPLKKKYIHSLGQLLGVHENDLQQFCNFFRYVRFCAVCVELIRDCQSQILAIEKAQATLLKKRELIESKLVNTLDKWVTQVEELESFPRAEEKNKKKRKRKEMEDVEYIPGNKKPISSSDSKTKASPTRTSIKRLKITENIGPKVEQLVTSTERNLRSRTSQAHLTTANISTNAANRTNLSSRTKRRPKRSGRDSNPSTSGQKIKQSARVTQSGTRKPLTGSKDNVEKNIYVEPTSQRSRTVISKRSDKPPKTNSQVESQTLTNKRSAKSPLPHSKTRAEKVTKKSENSPKLAEIKVIVFREKVSEKNPGSSYTAEPGSIVASQIVSKQVSDNSLGLAEVSSVVLSPIETENESDGSSESTEHNIIVLCKNVLKNKSDISPEELAEPNLIIASKALPKEKSDNSQESSLSVVLSPTESESESDSSSEPTDHDVTVLFQPVPKNHADSSPQEIAGPNLIITSKTVPKEKSDNSKELAEPSSVVLSPTESENESDSSSEPTDHDITVIFQPVPKNKTDSSPKEMAGPNVIVTSKTVPKEKSDNSQELAESSSVVLPPSPTETESEYDRSVEPNIIVVPKNLTQPKENSVTSPEPGVHVSLFVSQSDPSDDAYNSPELAEPITNVISLTVAQNTYGNSAELTAQAKTKMESLTLTMHKAATSLQDTLHKYLCKCGLTFATHASFVNHKTKENHENGKSTQMNRKIVGGSPELSSNIKLVTHKDTGHGNVTIGPTESKTLI